MSPMNEIIRILRVLVLRVRLPEELWVLLAIDLRGGLAKIMVRWLSSAAVTMTGKHKYKSS